eukprot:5796716-Alexandrium_andersonii.AAC.1
MHGHRFESLLMHVLGWPIGVRHHSCMLHCWRGEGCAHSYTGDGWVGKVATRRWQDLQSGCTAGVVQA